MKTTLMIALCAAAMVISGCSTLTGSDSAMLQGTWSGKEIGATPESPRHLVFAGNRFDYHGADADDWCKGTFALRGNTQPKQLVITLMECGPAQYVGKSSRVIYKIEDGALEITGNEPGDPAVPASFDAPGARHMVFRKE